MRPRASFQGDCFTSRWFNLADTSEISLSASSPWSAVVSARRSTCIRPRWYRATSPFREPFLTHRHEFSAGTIRIIALRAGQLCSHPNCRAPTVGPADDPNRSINVGVAAHITAASPKGPRYDHALAKEERTAAENGIWLCQTHAKDIDSDPPRFPAALLRTWKNDAETRARRDLGRPIGSGTDETWIPLYLPSIEPSDRGRLSFATRTIPFVGRQPERDDLDVFIASDTKFAWTTVSGAAGSGKSRLMLEFCLSLAPSWTAGFLEGNAVPPDWSTWKAAGPTFMVVDYVSSRITAVRRMLVELTGRSSLAHPVRIVLLDRVVDEDWERRLLGGGSEMLAVLQRKHSSANVLGPLSAELAGSLGQKILALSGRPASVEHVAAQLEGQSRLPLFLAMAAYADL